MKNQQQSQLEQDEIRHEAIKQEIREALKQGPGLAKEIGQRMGMQPNEVVGYLHEMLDAGDITFNWIRGYKL